MKETDLSGTAPGSDQPVREPIAIVGIGCRFPGGGSDPASFWKMLCEGVDAITEVPADRWNNDAFYHPEPGKPGRTNSRWGGFVSGIDQFDPHFFGISEREAAFLDPQHRMVLETSWEALEDAGQVLDLERGTNVGVFLGIGTRDYAQLQSTLDDRTTIDVHTSTGGTMSIAANRVSYCLNLRGPSLAVDTACSSALVAVHLACLSLWKGECEMALTGGVNLLLSVETTLAFSRMAMLSPTGRCKAFDAAADGYVRGEGAGMVLLKPFSAARANGDPIYALIRGSALNQDGRTNGLTVPSLAAQTELVSAACRDAGVRPGEVRFIETHGTGTPVGDPIEANALGTALSPGRAPGATCVIGSVKTNIGHLETGSGAAGLIKAALALKHGVLPPHLHFSRPNPLIDFDALRLRVVERLEPLPNDGRPVYAGVNSFGYGGANAHILLENAPPSTEAADTRACDPAEESSARLLPLSGRTASALQGAAQNWRDFLLRTETPLRDLCHTAGARRRHHSHRLAVVGRSKAELAEKLGGFLQGERPAGLTVGEATLPTAPKLVFVFGGQGSQWWGMGRELLRDEPAFREQMAECDALLRALGADPVLEQFAVAEAESRLQEPAVAQWALFSVQVALAALLRAWGIQPQATVGHSLGEVAAAHLAGVLTIEDAARVIYERGRCTRLAAASGAGGRMLAVGLPPAEAAALLAAFPGQVELGAVNSPASVTLTGELPALETIARTLEERGVFCRFLRVNFPYHSSRLDPWRDELLRGLAGIRPRSETIPIFSTVTGRAAAGADFHAGYWWENARQAVQFAPAVDSLLDQGHDLFLEVGPHPVLAGPLRECLHPCPRKTASFATLRREQPERPALLAAAAALHVAGGAVDWRRLTAGGTHAALPAYPWQRQRYWHEAEEWQETRLREPTHPLLGRRLKTVNPTWEQKIHVGLLPYLKDHRTRNQMLFPGAGYTEMALAAATELFGDVPVVLEEVAFKRPLLWNEDGENPRLQLSVQDSAFEIHSRTKGGEWVCHCAGKLRPLAVTATVAQPAEPPDFEAIGARTNEEFTQKEFYAPFRSSGLDLGASFRSVQSLWRGPQEVLADVETPDLSPAGGKSYRWHPASLDAAYQLLAAAPGNDTEKFRVMGGFQRLRVHAPPARQMWVYLHRVRHTRTDVEADLAVYDKNGCLLLEVQRAKATIVGPAHSSESLSDCLYELRWEERPLPENPATEQKPPHALLYGGSDAFAQEFARKLESTGGTLTRADSEKSLCRALEADVSPTVVVCWCHDEEACPRAVGLAQLLASRSDPPPLWLVTRGAQGPSAEASAAAPTQVAQAPIIGLGRVIMNEHPNLRCRLLDLSADSGEAQPICDELRCRDGEDEVAWRGARRFALRWAPVTLARLPLPRRQARRDEAIRLENPTPGTLENLSLRTIKRRPPGPDEVEIEVCAAGLNFRDVMKSLGIYPTSGGEDSLLLGDECAGRIAAVGERVTNHRVGDEVIVFFPGGSFASRFTAHSLFASRKPANLSFAEAASIPTAFLTAHYALKELAQIQPGERVLIHAATGGVGLAAIQVARLAGAEIFATAGSPEKRARLRRMGIAHVMDSRTLEFADEVMECTGGQGVDVILNSLAGPAIAKGLSCLAVYGRFVEIGKRDIFRDSRIGLLPFHKCLSLFSLDVGRLFLEKPARMASILQGGVRLFEQGALQPLPVEVVPVAEATGAFRRMAQAKHTGKIALDFSGAPLPAAEVPAAENGPRFDAEATYLITGGLGGFGLAMAEWLAENGARNLVLAGRSGASDEAARAKVAALRETGARIVVETADVSNAADVERVVRTAAGALPPLRGVIHCAMVLDDGALSQLDGERFDRVMAPKARGAWNLHVHTADLALDFFVLFSSVSSVLGNPGQANYAAANAYLDGLAHYRRTLGLPALSINWGQIAGVGVAARQAKIAAHLDRRGLAGMAPREAAALVGQLIQRDVAQIAVVKVDWSKLAEFLPGIRVSRRFERVIAQTRTDASPASGLTRDKLLAVPAGARLELMEAYLRESLSKVLGGNVASIESSRPLNELGLDSLMAVDLVNRLEAGLGMAIPTGAVMGSLNILRLARTLLDLLGGVEGPASPEAPAHAPAPPAPVTANAGTPMQVQYRPLLPSLLSGERPPIDSASLMYLPEWFRERTGLTREAFVRHWFQGSTRVSGVIDTALGRIGIIALPLFGKEVYHDPPQLLRHIVASLEIGRQTGASVVSLMGLIPSATDYGAAVGMAVAGKPDLPVVTTGHAATTAAVVMNLENLLRVAGRGFGAERLGVVGLGSIGLSALRLMLRVLPHPREITLCDLHRKTPFLDEVRRELVGQAGFTGPVHVAPAAGAVPARLYEQSVLLGATSAPGVLEVARLTPGTLLVDDSSPPCFDVEAAAQRFERDRDILFTNGGMLHSPEPISETVSMPEDSIAWVDQAIIDAFTRRIPDTITACVLAGVLTARFPELPPTIGAVDTDDAQRYLDALRRLHFSAAPLHAEGYALDETGVAEFRRRFGA